MPVALNGSTSGSVTITAPAVAGTNTLTLPAVTDTLVGLAATQTLTGKTLTSPTITGAVVSSMGSSVLTSDTAVASTSGTSIDFTSIPSWVKRITVMLSGVSTSGTSAVQIQIGDSGGFEITGYSGSATGGGSGVGSSSMSAGFLIESAASLLAANTRSGNIIITKISANLYSVFGVIGYGNTAISMMCGGSKTLSDTLTQVRITTVNGTDTFDAGTINIMYE